MKRRPKNSQLHLLDLGLEAEEPPLYRDEEEYHDQVALFRWLKLMSRSYPNLNLAFATLNGVRLPIGLAVKMKQAGNRRGVPDICLPLPVYWPDGRHFCGMWLELKRRKGGRVTADQQRWHDELRRAGYYVAVAKGVRAAIDEIRKYTGI